MGRKNVRLNISTGRENFLITSPGYSKKWVQQKISDYRAINEYLESEYPVQFLKLSLLYDDHFWDVAEVQQDHIFLKALFLRSNPKFAELLREKQELFKSLMNRAANIQPLMDTENNEKRAKSFDKWIKTQDESFLKAHLIPDDDEVLQFKN